LISSRSCRLGLSIWLLLVGAVPVPMAAAVVALVATAAT
jgi:hypothetical protein